MPIPINRHIPSFWLLIRGNKYCKQGRRPLGELGSRLGQGWRIADPLVVSKTVGKNGNEHLRNEERFICLCCSIEDLLFAIHTQ